MTYLSPTFNRDLWAYIDTCNKRFMTPICRTSTPVQLWLIYFHIGWTGVLVDGIHYLVPQQNRHLRRHNGTCNSAPLPYLDEDVGTTATHWLSWCFFFVKTWFLSMNETRNPQHLESNTTYILCSPGPCLLTWFNRDWVWMIDYTHYFLYGVITHPCPNVNRILTKPSLRLERLFDCISWSIVGVIN